MNVIVTEYANDVEQAAGQQVIKVDPHDMQVKVGVATTSVTIDEIPVSVGVGQLTVRVAQGLQGPEGPAGPSGGYNPVSGLYSNIGSITIPHSFPYLPEVRLVELSSGLGVDVGVEYPDSSHVYIEFPQPFTGYIILS